MFGICEQFYLTVGKMRAALHDVLSIKKRSPYDGIMSPSARERARRGRGGRGRRHAQVQGALERRGVYPGQLALAPAEKCCRAFCAV